MTDPLDDFIRDCELPEPTDIAAAVFEHYGVPAKWRELFGLPMVQYCRNVARCRTRAIERQVDYGRGDTREASRSDRGEHLPVKRLLSESFSTGDGMVTWGSATVADHEARIGMLRKFVAGYEATIDRHEWAISEIHAANARCLNDVEAVAA